MIIRQEREGLTLISQPAHAWVSGQIARHWGNDRFEPVCEEVCLAAELHDIGFLQWDTAPQMNPDTGMPFSFLEMPTATHLKIWTEGITRMRRYGRYPALLVSMHFTEIAKRANHTKEPSDQKLISQFLDEQEEVQTALLTSLQNDHYYSPRAEPELVKRDQQFVSLADWISLLLCLGGKEEKLARSHPATEDGPFELEHSPLNNFEVRVKPWPFRLPTLDLLCEGRRLLSRFTDDDRMKEAIQGAAPVTLRFQLKPAD